MNAPSMPSRALRALRRGEISLRTYVADRVQHAVAPLADRLTPRQLRWVAQLLRARIRVDPVLASYIERLKDPEPRSDSPPSGPPSVG
jgi:hypothetical protein